MSISTQGRNLIFLISQSRAGSTMTQRILGAHPLIHAVPEPWILLHPFYALRENGYKAEYRALLARAGLRNFLDALPNGEEAYYEGVRRMFTYLYQQSMVEGKQFFLDKTPRYFLIIPELARTFPEAKFLILFRNPLAVLFSTLNWKHGAWSKLQNHRLDLLDAPALLLAGLATLGDKALCVHYEKLVRSPDEEFKKVCDWLGIPFAPEMIEYGQAEWPQERRGGDTKAHEYQRPRAEGLDKWQKALHEPQFWRTAYEYLEFLGPEVVSKMGYDAKQLTQILAEAKPRSLRSTVSFHRFLTPDDHYAWLERLLTSLRAHGLGVTLRTLFRNRRI